MVTIHTAAAACHAAPHSPSLSSSPYDAPSIWRASGGRPAPDSRASSDAPAARIFPEPGGVVLMLSEAIPHAVEVTNEKRLGLAGWWRVNQSGMDRIDPLS